MQNIRYWILLLLESIGAAIIVIRGIPIYKALLLRYDVPTPESGAPYLGILAIFLIQVPHWYKQNRGSIPIVPKSNILSTIIAFIARLFFIFAAAFFSVLFFIRYEIWSNASVFQFFMALAVIFSIFCYCRDLEELAEDFKIRNKP